MGRNADIYVFETATKKQHVITEEEFDNWWPMWSPDSKYLAFLSDRDGGGKPSVWTWSTKDGTLRKVSRVIAAVAPLEWSPDGRQILFARSAESPQGRNQSNTNVDRLETPGSTVAIYDNSTQRESDPWNLMTYSMSLELAEIEGGKTTELVHGQIGTYKFSPDGSHLALTEATRFEAPGSQQILFDLKVVDINGGAFQTAASDLRIESDGRGFSWSPDGKQLCVRTVSKDAQDSIYSILSLVGESWQIVKQFLHLSGVGAKEAPLWDAVCHRIYFLKDGKVFSGDLASTQVSPINEIRDREITQIISYWNDVVRPFDQYWILVLTHDATAKQDGIYAVNLANGQSRKILEQGYCYTCILDVPSIASNVDSGQIAFVAEDGIYAPDLWVGSPRVGSFQQVTHLNPAFNPKFMGEARLVNWLSDDGEKLQGVVLLPPDYQPAERYPLVTYVYGGVRLSNRLDRFGLAQTGPLNMQLLATRGFAVFLPDAPLRPRTSMLSLAKVVLPGINKVIELGYADPDRLALIGHSFGGYSTLALIAQTNRFRAAVVIAGDSDLLSLYGEMRDDGTAYGIALNEYGQVGVGGTPWEHREAFIENSPFFYFDRVQTPVLIVQGTNDPVVASFLADQTFVALRRLGKEVEYAKYSGEGHSPAQEWSYSNQVDFCTRMIRWLEGHLNSK